MTGWIGIALGDLTGIGPEVTLKALAGLEVADSHRYLLIGDVPFIQRENQRLGLNLPFHPYGSPCGAASSSLISPSLPSDGGEGWGEEVRPYWFPLS